MISLLVLIYSAFIGLGLQDSLLGSAWPSMYAGLGVPIGSAGILSMIIAGGTIISTLSSGRVVRRFGTRNVICVCIAMTSTALMGFSVLDSFILLCLCAVPIGLGAGMLDASLNNFIALHYKAKHMSWLHCFWGVGAFTGPIVMSFALIHFQSWQLGYRAVSVAQYILLAMLLLSLPLWKKVQTKQSKKEEKAQEILSMRQVIALPGAKQAMLTFFLYCSVEATVGLWGSSYLVIVRGMPAETAARFTSLYFFGITFGRFLSGFLTMKLRNKQMVQLGQLLIGVGIIILLLPVHGNFLVASLFLIGLGCAPIFPSLIHETPVNFDSRYSQTMIGVQMASAYMGITFMPPIFGLIGMQISYSLFPVFIGIFLLLMILMVVLLYKKTQA